MGIRCFGGEFECYKMYEQMGFYEDECLKTNRLFDLCLDGYIFEDVKSLSVGLCLLDCRFFKGVG